MQKEQKQKPKQGKDNDMSSVHSSERDERENTEHTQILRPTGLQSFALMCKQTCSESLNDLIVNMKSASSIYVPKACS